MSAIPRNEGESQEDYKVRRAADHEATKKALKGKLVWDSYYLGTYENKKKQAKRVAKQQLKGI